MKHRGPFGFALFLALAAALLITPACGGGGGGGGAPPAPAANLSPFFGCVKSVVTAGGPRILVCWSEATDDNDASSAIRYRVYLSATSGGFNFAAPVALSAPGARCLQLTSADSGLISVGTEVFVAVRAVDTAGAESENEVECACTPVPTAAIAYCDDGAAGPGTLGDPADPFNTLQTALDAVPAAGGAVLVAGGSYNAVTADTNPGNPGSTIAIYGGFDGATFVAGASPQPLLAGHSPGTNTTTINGGGIDPTLVVDQVGQIDFRNAGRRTYVGTLRFLDNEGHVMLGLVEANAVVCGCHFEDPTDAELALGILANEGAPGDTQSLDVVGCFFDQLNRCIRPTGGFQRIVAGGNRGEDCDYFLYGILDTTQPIIPNGGDVLVCYDCNDITRIDGNAFVLDWDVASVGSSGNLDFKMVRNRITGANSDNRLDGGFGEAFAGGTIDIMVDDNFLGPIDSNALDIHFLPGNDSDIEYVRAATVTITVRDTTFVHMNSDAIDVERLTPGDGATITFLTEDCVHLQNDSECYDLSSHETGGSETFSQDGSSITSTFRRINAFSTDGVAYWRQPVFRGGTSSVVMYDNVADAQTDEFYDGVQEYFQTPVTAQANDTAGTSWHAWDNTHYSHYTSSTDFCRSRMDVASPDCVYECLRNTSSPGDDVIDIDFYVLNVPGAVLDLRIEGNRINSRDDDNAIDLDINEDGGTAAVAYVSICNNQLWTGRDVIEIYVDELLTDMRGYVLIAHNDLAGFTEGDGMDLRFYGGFWSGVIARNLLRGGGDDSEVGLGVSFGDECKGGDFVVRNNLLVGTGEGITVENDGQGGLQIINNTVTHTGEGSTDSPMGVDHGGLNSPCFVLNGISQYNAYHDVPEETIAQYTNMEEPVGSAGLGSILGSPLFRFEGTILDPITYFALNSNSPTIDAGDPRPEFNDPDGSRNDMGAFGGPGAGALGYLAAQATPCPLVVIGIDPIVDLYGGASLITGATPVRLLFSDEINGATANSTTMPITIGGLPVAGTYVTSGHWVTFTPTAVWMPGAQVRIGATTGIQSSAGAALSFNHWREFGVRPAATTVETEGNDTAGTANALAADPVQRLSGDLSSDADRDFFAISGSVGDRLQASLWAHRLNPGTAADFGIRLYAADGTTVLYENSYGLYKRDPYIDYTLRQTGTYYIEIFDEASGAGAGPFAWELELNRN